MPVCPNCASAKTVKNGRIHNGKQRFKCHECGRQFVEQPRLLLRNYGKPCLRSIANVPSHTLMSGQRMGQCCRASVIEPWAKRQV